MKLVWVPEDAVFGLGLVLWAWITVIVVPDNRQPIFGCAQQWVLLCQKMAGEKDKNQGWNVEPVKVTTA